jgi:hypothetical protein
MKTSRLICLMVGRKIAPSATGLVVALALASCASVTVEPGQERSTQRMPDLVYVMPFGTSHADFEVDRTGAELADFKKNLQLMMKTAIMTDLTDRLVPAVDGTKSGTARAMNAWVVRGQFTTVKQGSRLLRSAIGFGAGGTKVETRVEVYDFAEQGGAPILTFSTTGGSGAEPGAILAFTTDPLTIAIGGVSGAAHGLSEDTKRTARMITAQLSDYMYRHGWITQDEWIKPKQPSGNNTGEF